MNTLASVLLVEDHADSAAVMARLLRLSGYEVVLAGSVQEARDAVDTQHFDVAVCDIRLPDGDGCDLMSELFAGHGLNGIALTGLATPGEIDRASEAGFRRHLAKPVVFEHLRAAIDECGLLQPHLTPQSESKLWIS